ncbi:hypothetical protein HYS47_04675 [Candidatus Woesearchaeota archaeon]|nr:hypothetical protein [Candidatus Woesearchaeota archaeon]
MTLASESISENSLSRRMIKEAYHHSVLACRHGLETMVVAAILPTARRIEMENRKKRDEQRQEPVQHPDSFQPFLEDVVLSAIRNPVIATNIVLALSAPNYGLALLTTNACSLLYETGRKAWRLITKREEKEITKQQEGESPFFRSVYDLVRSSYHAAITSIKALPRTLVSESRKTVRALGVYAAGWGLLSVLSIGHYTAVRSLGYEPSFNEQVTVSAYECQAVEGRQKQFYLLGEIHLYNSASSQFVSHVLHEHPINIVLSEGVMEHVESSRASPKPKQKKAIAEHIISAAYNLTLNHLRGGQAADAVQIAVQHELPVIGLESRDNNGIRQGMSASGNAVIGVLGALCIAYGPSIYIATAVADHAGHSFFSSPVLLKVSDVIGEVPNSIVHGRNTAMADRIVSYRKNNPDSTPLIVLGHGHISDMIHQLGQRYGGIHCQVLNQ